MRPRVFLLVDAMGWEVCRRHGAFNALAPNRTPLGTVLGYSAGAIPTILSGRMPEEHGHWALFQRAQGASPFAWTWWLRLLPRSWQHRYRVRRYIREATQRREGITGYFQIYDVPLWLLKELDYTERRDLWSAGGLLPLPSVFDRWNEAGVRYFNSGWQGEDAAKFDRALEAAKDPGTGTFLIYATGLDALMHRVGTKAPEVAALLRDYESRLARLLEALRGTHGEDAGLWIFSDHGMTDTLGSHDLMAAVARLRLREGRDFLAFYDSTMARFWFLAPAARAAIEDFLAGLPYGRRLASEELRAHGLAFPDSRYGEAIFLMNPGQLIAPSHMGTGAPRAMHGFAPDDADSPGALLTPGALPAGVAHIRDLYRLMTD